MQWQFESDELLRRSSRRNFRNAPGSPPPPSPTVYRLPPPPTPHTHTHAHTHTHTRTHTRLHPGSAAPKAICETVKPKLLYEINHVREKPSQPHTLCVSVKL